MKAKFALDRKLPWSRVPKYLLFKDPKKLSVHKQVKTALKYSQLKYAGMIQMFDHINDIDKREVPGAIVETGGGRGGCCAFMAHCSERNGSNRDVWLYDSFEGLSEPEEKDFKGSKKDPERIRKGYLAIGKEVAEEAIAMMNLKQPEKVHIVEGWIEDTLPKTKEQIGPISIIRLDVDLYEPTKYTLEQLFDQLSPGGYVVLDDYENWAGSRRALFEFFYEHDVFPIVRMYPHKGRAYFIKE